VVGRLRWLYNSRMAIERVRKLNALTALRFVAAAGVVVYHSEGHFGVPARWGGSRLPLGMGVSFFFVLSGFVLAYVYPALDDCAKRRKFWRARFARVWPAHLGALLVLWGLFRHVRNFPMGYGSWWMAGLNVLMVHGWVPIQEFYFSYNPVSWSLSTELGFYLLFPLLIWRWERTWWWKFLAAFAVVAGLVYLCQSGIVPNTTNPWKAQWVGLLVTNPLARLFEFMLGMLGALVYRKTRPRIHMGMALGTLVEVAAVALMAYNFSHTDVVFRLQQVVPHVDALMVWLAQPTCALTFLLVIYVLALEQGVMSRLLGMSAGVLLGEISFSVYLLHDLILTYYVHHEASFAGYAGWKLYGGYWVIVLLASWLMWAGFERPVRAWLVQLPRMRKKDEAAAIASTGASAGQWGPLFTPSWRALGVGAGALVACLLPVLVILGHPARLHASIEQKSAKTQAAPIGQK
jgi:peptidoglycan/LPS O-acetylase OafA/YrhL